MPAGSFPSATHWCAHWQTRRPAAAPLEREARTPRGRGAKPSRCGARDRAEVPLSCPLESLRWLLEIMLPLNVRSYGQDCRRLGATSGRSGTPTVSPGSTALGHVRVHLAGAACRRVRIMRKRPVHARLRGLEKGCGRAASRNASRSDRGRRRFFNRSENASSARSLTGRCVSHARVSRACHVCAVRSMRLVI